MNVLAKTVSPPKRTLKKVVKKTFINAKGYRETRDVIEEVEITEPVPVISPPKPVPKKEKPVEEEKSEPKKKKSTTTGAQMDIMKFFNKK